MAESDDKFELRIVNYTVPGAPIFMAECKPDDTVKGLKKAILNDDAFKHPQKDSFKVKDMVLFKSYNY